MFEQVARQPWPAFEVPTGTGFFVDTAGHFMTAAHVIAGCGKIVVTAHSESEVESWPATLLGLDARVDAALLSVPGARPSPYLQLGEAKLGESAGLRVPAWSPNDHTFHVSNAAPLRAKTQKNFGHLFELSVTLQPGASGAAVLRADGMVAGYIVGRAAGERAVALAVPVSYARRFLGYFNVIQSGRARVVKVGSQTVPTPTMRPSPALRHGWAQVECR